MFKNAGRVKRTIEEYFVLTVATLILVVGVYVFKFPNNFSFGGVTGIAVVLSAIMPDLFFLEKVLESRLSMSVC